MHDQELPGPRDALTLDSREVDARRLERPSLVATVPDDGVTPGGLESIDQRGKAPALDAKHRTHLLRETAEGFRLVFGRPVLRALASIVFGAAIFVIVPEGLAAGLSLQERLAAREALGQPFRRREVEDRVVQRRRATDRRRLDT